jgi:hypothetical protein
MGVFTVGNTYPESYLHPINTTMLPKFNKQQQVIVILLIVLIIAFVSGPLTRLFNSLTAAEYEPWDPDNEMVLKNNITQMNQEGEQINRRITLLLGYKQSLDEAYKTLGSYTLDTPYFTRLESIQPYSILGGIAANADATPLTPNMATAQPDITLADLKVKIMAESQRYITEYAHLLDNLNLSPPLYPPLSTDNKIIVSLKGEMVPRRRDSARLYGDSQLVAIPLPPLAAARATYQTGTSSLMQIIGAVDTLVSEAIKTSQDRRTIVEANLSKLRDDFNKKNFSINKFAVIIGIPFFIVAALLMYWFGIRASNNIARGQGAGTEDFKLGLSFTLNTITVLLLILSLLILGLAKVVQENTLAALLGAIAGYILNNATDKGSSKTPPPPVAHPAAGPAGAPGPAAAAPLAPGGNPPPPANPV